MVNGSRSVIYANWPVIDLSTYKEPETVSQMLTEVKLLCILQCDVGHTAD